jgi:hypothetical protein
VWGGQVAKVTEKWAKHKVANTARQKLEAGLPGCFTGFYAETGPLGLPVTLCSRNPAPRQPTGVREKRRAM